MWFVLQALFSTGYGTSAAGDVAYVAHVVGFVVGALLALPRAPVRWPGSPGTATSTLTQSGDLYCLDTSG